MCVSEGERERELVCVFVLPGQLVILILHHCFTDHASRSSIYHYVSAQYVDGEPYGRKEVHSHHKWTFAAPTATGTQRELSGRNRK